MHTTTTGPIGPETVVQTYTPDLIPWYVGTVVRPARNGDWVVQEPTYGTTCHHHWTLLAPVAPCPCACNRGGFCGGCGHAGCGGRR